MARAAAARVDRPKAPLEPTSSARAASLAELPIQIFAKPHVASDGFNLDQHGPARLSEREHQVLDRLAEGASNQDIANALHISPGTVRKHLENIYTKLEVTSRTAALARTGRTTGTIGE